MWYFFLSCTSTEIVPLRSDIEKNFDLVDAIDPMIATGGIGFGVGCAYPGSSHPLGMVKLSPDTSNEWLNSEGYYRGGGYHYDDVHIEGFSHMHLHGIGLTDYGVLAVMPVNGMNADRTHRTGMSARFSHEDETVVAGRYSVTLEDAQVDLGVTPHTGLHRYAFTAEEPVLLLDLGHSLGRGVVTSGEVSIEDNGQRLTGWMIHDGEMSDSYPIYFVAELDQSPQAFGVWDSDELQPATSEAFAENQDVRLGAWLEFPSNTTVSLRVAISNVDLEGAQANFQAEHTGFDMEQTWQNSEDAWRDALANINARGGTEAQQRIFATALYHTLQMPTLFSDVDHRYRGFDGEIHNHGRPFYTDFSLWDTYRTTHPLYTFLWPDLHADLLWSLGKMVTEGGGIPRWPLANTDTGIMLGTSLNIVFAEAVRKGVQNFEEDELYNHLVDYMWNGVEPTFGAPPSLSWLDDPGWYPADFVGRSTAWNLEQAIGDAALGLLAQEKGDDEVAEGLLERSETYQNLYDPQVGFFHGRNLDGTWADFNSEDGWLDDYAEGNARQYLWLVPQNPSNLFELMGGTEVALARLQRHFEEMEDESGENTALPEMWYWHGNEVGLHVPHFFALLGEKSEGNEWIRWLQNNRYSDTPEGLAGNDDGGTLSAWYVFSALGLTPLPGTTDYVLGEPMFEHVRVDNGREVMEIARIGNGEVDAVFVDGEPWTQATISHDDLGHLRFELH